MVLRRSIILLICLALATSAPLPAEAETPWPQVAFSADGVPISFEVHGDGEPALVFVHGWSCDARYWSAQTPLFSLKHRVIILDLAGHGHSGMGRSKYTMGSFGEDVRAVVEATDTKKAILVGHSMGGYVIAEAARLMPDRVIGLIGVDTLENIEYSMTSEDREAMIAPFREDFQTGTRDFVGQMISPRADESLREWIISDMSAAPPWVALSSMEEMVSLHVTGELPGIFSEVRVPVVTVNADKWPIDFDANRRHMLSYEAIVIPDSDHFLMIDKPDEFNDALEKAVEMVLWEAGK